MTPRFSNGGVPMFTAAGLPMLCDTDICCPCGEEMFAALGLDSRTIEVDSSTALPDDCLDSNTPKLLPYITSNIGLGLLARWRLTTSTPCFTFDTMVWRLDMVCVGGGPNAGKVEIELTVACSQGTVAGVFEEFWDPSLVYERFGGHIPFSMTAGIAGFGCTNPWTVTITP